MSKKDSLLISLPQSKKMIKELSFCVFDLETTGGNHNKDKIIEIGLVKIEKMKITKKKNYLINPERNIPIFIQKLTSIGQEDVKNAPLIEDIVDDILEFMGDSILVAHNVSFDVPFFNSVLKRLKIPTLKNKTICTNMMTRYIIPNIVSSNLNYISNVFNIKHKKAHRALDDALAAANLLLIYLKIFVNKNIKKINHLYYPQKRYALDSAHYRNNTPIKEIIKKAENIVVPLIITIKDKNGLILHSFPYHKKLIPKKVISNHLNNIKEWDLISFNIYGSICEAIYNFNSIIKSFKLKKQKEIINELCEIYLKNKSVINITEVPQFIIVRHLVHKQLFIYSSNNLFNRPLLIRYPENISSICNYIKANKTKTSTKVIHHKNIKNLTTFLKTYIYTKSSKYDPIFFVDKNMIENQDILCNNIEKFLSDNPNTYNYPKQYI